MNISFFTKKSDKYIILFLAMGLLGYAPIITAAYPVECPSKIFCKEANKPEDCRIKGNGAWHVEPSKEAVCHDNMIFMFNEAYLYNDGRGAVCVMGVKHPVGSSCPDRHLRTEWKGDDIHSVYDNRKWVNEESRKWCGSDEDSFSDCLFKVSN